MGWMLFSKNWAFLASGAAPAKPGQANAVSASTETNKFRHIRVGRVTPCAPQSGGCSNRAHGVPRPTLAKLEKAQERFVMVACLLGYFLRPRQKARRERAGTTARL